MMKKIVAGLTVALCSLMLFACQPEKEVSTAWLEGEWHSTEWDLTYDIDEDNGKWSIEFDEGFVVENADLSVEGKTFTLTDKEGTRYVIEQQSETEILYQKAGDEGVAGTTTQVTFEKVGD